MSPPSTTWVPSTSTQAGPEKPWKCLNKPCSWSQAGWRPSAAMYVIILLFSQPICHRPLQCPRKALLVSIQGQTLVQLGREEKATEVLSEATQMHPKAGCLHLALANSFAQQKALNKVYKIEKFSCFWSCKSLKNDQITRLLYFCCFFYKV